MEALVAGVDQGGDGQAAGEDGGVLDLLGQGRAVGTGVELNEDMAEGGDVLVAGAVLAHRVDAHEEAEACREAAVDASLGEDALPPLGRGEGDAGAGRDLAVLVLGGRGDGDELAGEEGGVEKLEEAVLRRFRQRAWQRDDLGGVGSVGRIGGFGSAVSWP